MNENINIVDILKDCPRGTKLYSTIHGEVKFEQIITNNSYPIVFSYSDMACERYIGSVTKDGRHERKYCGECTLFPSKENRDWSKYKVEPEMVDGEIYYAKTNLVEWIYIYKRNNTFKTNHYVAILNNFLMEFDNVCTTQTDDIKELRKATDEEKRLFFEMIEKNGRKWDADKKELVKAKHKFDINTLKPFDKVLVRNFDYECVWRCTFYECFTRGMDYPFLTMHGLYKQCIPYNDETKHLVRTNEMPSEKYITWEE